MEILNTYSVYNDALSVIFVLGFCCAIAIFILSIINVIFTCWIDALKCFIASIVIAVVALGFGVVAGKTEKVYHEVLITDYNKVDFEKYEMVEKKGKIVVFKEIK